VNKYRAQKTRLDGFTFDSKREAAHYAELKLLEKAGHVNAIEVHPRFNLHATGSDGIKRKIGQYEADFRYWCCRRKERVIADVKGYFTDLSRWKIRHFEAEYQTSVEIVK